MTDDKLIELARKAGINAESDTLCRYEGWVGPLKQFAALVLANNPPQSFMSWQEGYEAGKTAQRPWVGLSQEDIDISFDDTQEGGGFDDFARAIEAKLKEKNT